MSRTTRSATLRAQRFATRHGAYLAAARQSLAKQLAVEKLSTSLINRLFTNSRLQPPHVGRG
jgi:hypothetical protein